MCLGRVLEGNGREEAHCEVMGWDGTGREKTLWKVGDMMGGESHWDVMGQRMT